MPLWDCEVELVIGTKEKVALPLLTTLQTAEKWRSKFNRQLIPKADEGRVQMGKLRKPLLSVKFRTGSIKTCNILSPVWRMGSIYSLDE